MKNAAKTLHADTGWEAVHGQRVLMKTFIQRIIDALSKLEASGDHPFARDFQTYFRNAIARLDRFEINQPEGIQELAAFMTQIENVATTFLTLLEQAKLIEPIDRIGDV